MGQPMKETLFETADAGDTLSDSRCRKHSIRQRMQETLYGTGDAEDTPWDSGCRRHSMRRLM